MTEIETTTREIDRHDLIRLASGVGQLCDDLFAAGPLAGRDLSPETAGRLAPVLRSAGAALQRAVAELREPVSPEHI